MSPLPTSFSAPGWSRMTRESVRLDTANAMRAGMLALITPVMTFTLGRCVATIRWMPTARAFWAMRVIDSSTSRAATIIRSLSSSTTTTMYGSRSYCRSPIGRTQLALVERRVVAADVAEADLVQQVVAALHLLHRPAEGVGRLLRVGDRLGEQVRQTVVLAHLDLLGVDEDQPHLVGRRAHQQRRDDAVDAARLARAGGPGDQQVRRGGQVEEHRLAGDVLADGDVERPVAARGLRARRAGRRGRRAGGCGWAPRRRSPSGRGSGRGCGRRWPPWRRRCRAAGSVTRATLTPAPSSSS